MKSGAQLGTAFSIHHWNEAKLGSIAVMHSTGRSERCSWMAAYSGWMSDQNSCSGSVRAISLETSSVSGTGFVASQALMLRASGSRARSSKRIDVPDRP